jgi:hypothetical protein
MKQTDSPAREDRELSLSQRPIRLRAHHLLCLQAYRGRGYSPRFVLGMNRVSKALREDPRRMIEISSGCDDLCQNCPHRREGEDGRHVCRDDQKVLGFDRAVLELSGFSEGDTKPYQDVIFRLNTALTPDRLKEICGSCSWYETAACAEKICRSE